MRSPEQKSDDTRPTEPIGVPDHGAAPASIADAEATDTGDFADEHDETVVDPDEPHSGETESPDRYSGGLDGEGPP